MDKSVDRTEQTEATDKSDKSTESAYDIETYRHAIEEARRTLDQQLDAFNDVNDKAWRIVQLNGIIATIYIAAVANALNDLTFTRLPSALIAIGLVMMGISVYLSAEGQEAKQVTIGQNTVDEEYASLVSNRFSRLSIYPSPAC